MTPRPARPAPGVQLPDRPALLDLHRYAVRARRVDPDGAVRLLGHGDVLAVYVAPLHGSGGPTVLGLRTLRLAEPCDLDLTTSLSALVDLLAPGVPEGTAAAGPSAADPSPGRPDGGATPVAPGPRLELVVPPVPPSAAAWAGMSPPRTGWAPVATVEPADLRRVVAAGVAEIVAGTPSTAGAAQVAALRARVWGRPLAEQLPGTPAGVAFAADALAFLDDAEPAAVYRRGSWTRLSTSRGHVLARPPALTGSPLPASAPGA